MPYEKKDFDFVLFINDTQGNDKRPLVSGNIFIGGKEVAIAGWKKLSKNGKKMIVGGVSTAQPKKEAPAKQDKYDMSDFKDSDMPF